MVLALEYAAMPGELEPVGRYGPDLATVWADMGEIFDRAGVVAPPPHLRRPASVSALRPRRSGGRVMASLAAAAAGLAGLGVGAFVIRSPQPSPPAPAQADRRSASDAPPASPPAASAPAEAGLGPGPAPGAAPGEAAAAKAVRSLARAPAKPRAVARPRTVLAKAPSHRALAVAQPASCEHNANGAGCRRAVILADRHLRDVYERAVRRGVPRDVLIDYRDRWANLRDSEHDDPVRLIENYGALAYDLGRESRDDEEGALRRRGPAGLKALADALLPWR